MPCMLNHVGTCWGEGCCKGGLQVCRVVSEIFPKNTFSNLSITIINLETVNSKNNQSFLEQSLKISYS